MSASTTLFALLSDGPVAVTEVVERMGYAGYTPDQTKRARSKLGVTTTRSGFGAGSRWYLALPTDDCPTCGRPMQAEPGEAWWHDGPASESLVPGGRGLAGEVAPSSTPNRPPAVCSVCGLRGNPGRCTAPLMDPVTRQPALGGRGHCPGYVL
jgi:hypothetical protein